MLILLYLKVHIKILGKRSPAFPHPYVDEIIWNRSIYFTVFDWMMWCTLSSKCYNFHSFKTQKQWTILSWVLKMGEHASHHLKRASSAPRTSYTCAADKPRAWDMTPINLGHALALIFVRLFLISLIASGGWEVALWVRVSQKIQKSEFWYATTPLVFIG